MSFRKRWGRLTVLAMSTSIVGVLCLSSAAPALALIPPSPPWQVTNTQDAVYRYVFNPNQVTTPRGYVYTPTTGVNTGIQKIIVDESVNGLPRIAKMATSRLLVAAIGLEIGWKIGRFIDTKWLHLHCSLTCEPSTYGTVVSNNLNIGTTTFGTTGWPTAPCNPTIVYSSGTPTGCAAILQLNLTGGGTTTNPSKCPVVTGGTICTAAAVDRYTAMVNSGFGTLIEATCPSTACDADFVGVNVPRVARVATEATMEDLLFDGHPLETWTNQPADVTTTMSPAPAATPTATQTAALSTALDAAPAQVQSTVECAVQAQDFYCPGEAGHPDGGAVQQTEESTDGSTTTVFQPFRLPRPLTTETYIDYVERLRTLGYLGSITVAADPDSGDYPAPSAAGRLAPDRVTKVQIGGSPAVAPLPLYWPTTEPAVDAPGYPSPHPSPYSPAIGTTIITTTAPMISTASVPIELTVKVLTPAEGGTGEPGQTVDLPLPPGAIDFTPLTDIDFGCKFPYGFISCYALGVTEWFDVEPTAPEFDFSLPDWGGAHYDVNLNIMDDYMEIWRGLLTVVIWIGAVYYVASRFLGFSAGGDPGAAIDDAIGW